jgi:hypothetical protein
MQIKIGEIKLYFSRKILGDYSILFSVISVIRVWNLNIIRILILL